MKQKIFSKLFFEINKFQNVENVVPKLFSTTTYYRTPIKGDHLLQMPNLPILKSQTVFPWIIPKSLETQAKRGILVFQRNSGLSPSTKFGFRQMPINWSHPPRKNFRCEKYEVEAPKLDQNLNIFVFDHLVVLSKLLKR